MKQLILALSFAFVALSSNAAVLDNTKITSIHSAFDGTDGITFKIDGIIEGTSCTGKSGFFLPKTHIQFNETLSMLLAASMANKTLKIGVDSCNAHGYPNLLWVEVFNS